MFGKGRRHREQKAVDHGAAESHEETERIAAETELAKEKGGEGLSSGGTEEDTRGGTNRASPSKQVGARNMRRTSSGRAHSLAGTESKSRRSSEGKGATVTPNPVSDASEHKARSATGEDSETEINGAIATAARSSRRTDSHSSEGWLHRARTKRYTELKTDRAGRTSKKNQVHFPTRCETKLPVTGSGETISARVEAHSRGSSPTEGEAVPDESKEIPITGTGSVVVGTDFEGCGGRRASTSAARASGKKSIEERPATEIEKESST